MEWQPIETAPKDRRILLWNGDFIASGAYEGGVIDGFIMHRDVDDDWSIDEPTHWMPLPAPPTD